MLAKEIGHLYVGGLNSPFGEIKVNKTLRQLDKKIIECSWDYEKNQWSFMRERTDKSFPNAYATAEGPISWQLDFNLSALLAPFIATYIVGSTTCNPSHKCIFDPLAATAHI